MSSPHSLPFDNHKFVFYTYESRTAVTFYFYISFDSLVNLSKPPFDRTF